MKMQRVDRLDSDAISYADEAYEEAFSAPSYPVEPSEFEEGTEEEVPWIENEDYSKSLTLSSGMTVTFRDMTGADLKFVDQLKGGNIDSTMRLACRLCIKWGDRDGVTPPQLDKVRAKDMMLISKTIESFLS